MKRNPRVGGQKWLKPGDGKAEMEGSPSTCPSEMDHSHIPTSISTPPSCGFRERALVFMT